MVPREDNVRINSWIYIKRIVKKNYFLLTLPVRARNQSNNSTLRCEDHYNIVMVGLWLDEYRRL